MIKYSRKFIPTFIADYWADYPFDVVGHRGLQFGDWLAQHGAELHVESDFMWTSINVLTFKNPEDEVAFRLKYDVSAR